MEYTKLGNSDVTVSRICMGCMGFGDATKGHHSWILDADQSREIIKYGFEHGITFYDTATGYAQGTSEEYIGRALRSIASKRLTEDQVAHSKYDATEAQDDVIIERVAEVAAKRGTSMTAVSLAWLLTKVTAPVVGMTKPHHMDGAIDAVKLKLTDEEIAYLEEPYVPHKLVGVMAFNH